MTQASATDVDQIRQIIKNRTFPKGIRRDNFDLKFGEDASGRPAVWVLLGVDRAYANPPAHWMSNAGRFMIELRSDLLNAHLGYWPYVDFKRPT